MFLEYSNKNGFSMKNEKIKGLRKKIDTLDSSLIDILNERVKVALEIGKEKTGDNLKVYHPEREQEVYEKVFALNENREFPDKAVKLIYNEIMSVSRELQRPLNVSYLGPKATYTHMAVLQNFGSFVNTYPVDSISDIFKSVETGKSDYGVVPVENSTEGMVTHTLDKFLDSPVKIVSEIYMNISHCLLSSCKDIESVKKLYAHPQSIAQCRIWIENNLRNVEINETSSNAKAAAVAVWDKFSAAIAGKIAATVYELDVIASGIEDNPENTTRFLVIGNEFCKPTGKDKTSIVCSVKDKSGALHDLLSAFSREGINMTKIESRPTKKKAWEYLFYIDVDGHKDDEKIKKALSNLEHTTQFMKILGSYPLGMRDDL